MGTIDKDKRAGEDNATISGRMQQLIDTAEQDIRTCANACNTYATKKLLSKVLHSSSWREEFKSHIKCFKSRRREFELALAIYTGHTINTVHDRVINVDKKVFILLWQTTSSLFSEQGGSHPPVLGCLHVPRRTRAYRSRSR